VRRGFEEIVMFENRVRSAALSAAMGQRVQLAGWVHGLRKLRQLTFVVLRDGWGTAQVVVELGSPARAALAGVRKESVIVVEGQVRAPPEGGPAELLAESLRVVSSVHEDLPVPLGRGLAHAKLPTQLDHAATVLRDPTRREALRLSAVAARAFREHLVGEGFTEVFTPKIVAGATEGGANVFALDYFGRKAFLAQSPQLYKQMMVGVFERVFEVGPVFRAEPHATVRHLSEYVSLDVEMGFIAGHRDVIALLVRVLRSMTRAVTERGVEAPAIPEQPPILDFVEARTMLAAAGLGRVDDVDLAPEEERFLGQWARTTHGSDVVVVEGFPLRARPFYTHPLPGDPTRAAGFDLLFRGLELVTGGQRIHEHDVLCDALSRSGAALPDFVGYLEAFRFGLPPHGGFAIGLERFVAQLLRAANIRTARAFPRDPTRSSP
jgi:nondiscriminating aspartyl-tRNA synthetase